MPFCASCGTQVADGVQFCQSCGAAMNTGAEAPAAASTSASEGSGAAAPPAASADSNDNLMGALSYIWIAAIIFLFIEPHKNNKYIRFHSFQSIFFVGASR